MVRLAMKTTAATLLAVTFASVEAHEWSGLSPATFDVRRLELAVEAAEGLQRAILAGGEAPTLSGEAWAADWLRWLTREARLHDRRESEALADRLVTLGFVDPGQRGLAVRAWRRALERVTLVADAVGRGTTPADATRLTDRLAEPDLDANEARRLSYAAWLGTVERHERDELSSLVERLSKLVRRAERAGAGS